MVEQVPNHTDYDKKGVPMLQLTGVVSQNASSVSWDPTSTCDQKWVSIIIRMSPNTYQQQAFLAVEKLLRAEPWFICEHGQWMFDIGELCLKLSIDTNLVPEEIRNATVLAYPSFDDGKWQHAFLDAEPMAYVKIPIDQNNIFLMPRTANLTVREALEIVLPTASDLERFLIDHFPTISNRRTEQMDRLAIINLLLQCHEPRAILGALVANPDQQQPAVRRHLLVLKNMIM